MQIKNPEILALIDSIGEHYRANINNRFTRRAITTMGLDDGTWILIEELTEKSANYKYQGYHFDELYSQILALSRFVHQARTQVSPNLRQLASTGSPDRMTDMDRVLRDMAVTNFGSNLKILADRLNELYVKVASLDKENSGQKPPMYAKMPELKEIGRYLVE